MGRLGTKGAKQKRKRKNRNGRGEKERGREVRGREGKGRKRRQNKKPVVRVCVRTCECVSDRLAGLQCSMLETILG